MAFLIQVAHRLVSHPAWDDYVGCHQVGSRGGVQFPFMESVSVHRITSHSIYHLLNRVYDVFYKYCAIRRSYMGTLPFAGIVVLRNNLSGLEDWSANGFAALYPGNALFLSIPTGRGERGGRKLAARLATGHRRRAIEATLSGLPRKARA